MIVRIFKSVVLKKSLFTPLEIQVKHNKTNYDILFVCQIMFSNFLHMTLWSRILQIYCKTE